MAIDFDGVERALGRWALDDADGAATLQAICDAVEASGVTCGVFRDEIVAGGARARRDAADLARARDAGGGRRMLVTPREGRWNQLFSAGWDAQWVACEPIASMDATLVLAASGEPLDGGLLPQLSRLTRACACVMSHEAARDRAPRLVHQINNLLAVVLSNAELIIDLVSDAPEDRANVERALANLRTALVQLGDRTHEVAAAASRKSR
jgi:hypothetical protein